MTFKCFLFSMCTLFSTVCGLSQRVGINTDGSAPDKSAILDVSSDAMGVLVPRLTTVQRDAISNPAEGLLIFNTDTKSFWHYTGSAWVELLPAPKMHTLQDSDQDTRVRVEGTPDDDMVRFDQGGVEYFRMDSGRLEVLNTGQSVFIGQEAGLNDNFTNNYNTAIGHHALRLNTNGYQNTALGWKTLAQSTDGHSNAAFGSYALYNNLTGDWNTALGRLALYHNQSGIYNVAAGFDAMRENISGHSNVAIGSYALYSSPDRNNLVAIGDSALYKNGIGTSDSSQARDNTAVGAKSMVENTLGDLNTALGYQSLRYNTSGRLNTALGANALLTNTEGVRNTAIGNAALNKNISGDGNTAVGLLSLLNNTEGDYNTALGCKALYHNTDRGYSVAVGYQALYSNGLNVTEAYHAAENTAVGAFALEDNTTGYDNVAVGFLSLQENTEGYGNTAIGERALRFNQTGANNVAIGRKALILNDSGDGNIAVGPGAMTNNQDGIINVAIGQNALLENISGSENVAIGYQAMYDNGTNATQNYHGMDNTGVGSWVLFNNTTGYYNTVIGHNAMRSNTTGARNTALGKESLFSSNSNDATGLGYRALYQTTGNYNTAVGSGAHQNLITGFSNTALGFQADHLNQFGERNTMIGMQAGRNTLLHSKSGCVFIGYQAGYNEMGDNKLYIHNTISSYPLIYGEFDSGKLGFHGNVGIQTKDPQAELHIFDGNDVWSDATIRMQSAGANNDCNIDFYENTAPAMSIYYSGSANVLQLIDLTSATTRVTFERGGDVGIGNTNPGHLLDVGTSGAYCDGGAWVDGSSRTFKTGIKALTAKEAIHAFRALNPVRFRYTSEPEEEYLGFIAEDVPDIVATNDRKGLSPMDIVAVLTKTVQELSKQVDALQVENREMKRMISSLEK